MSIMEITVEEYDALLKAAKARRIAVGIATRRLADLEATRRALAEAIKDRDNSLKIANMNHAQWERSDAALRAAQAEITRYEAECRGLHAECDSLANQLANTEA